MTLAEFLLARIAEDEAAWSQSTEFRVRADLTRVDMTMTERVLAECEVKRRIVDLHRGYGRDDEWAPEGYCGECEGTLSSPCATLRALASPYADHPDYDESWRP